MKREVLCMHSGALDRDVNMIVYGEGGYPTIVFQVQDAKCNNFEDFGMIDVLAPFIDGGQIQVFSVDSFDEDSWSSTADNASRAAAQERYFNFATDELVPFVQQINGSSLRPISMGCSMGATHAAIVAFRRPDLYQGCIAMSGVYRTGYFFGDWMNETLYNNDIPAFLTNMPEGHPYVDLYNHRQLVLCTGQGAWELGLSDVRYIDDQLRRLHAAHWCDYWGIDVSHDWPWWRKQVVYFLPEVLADIKRTTEAEAARAAEQQQAEAAAEAEAPVEVEATAEAEAPAEAEVAAEAPVEVEAPAEAAAEAEVATEAAVEAEAEVEAPAEAEAKTETPVEAAVEIEAAAEAEAPAEAPVEEKPAPKKRATRRTPTKKATAAKKTTTRRTTRKTTAKAAAAEEDAATTEPSEEKPATTTRKTTRRTTRKTAAAKADTADAAGEATEKKPATKRATTRKTTTRKTTRRSTKKADEE